MPAIRQNTGSYTTSTKKLRELLIQLFPNEQNTFNIEVTTSSATYGRSSFGAQAYSTRSEMINCGLQPHVN